MEFIENEEDKIANYQLPDENVTRIIIAASEDQQQIRRAISNKIYCISWVGKWEERAVVSRTEPRINLGRVNSITRIDAPDAM